MGYFPTIWKCQVMGHRGAGRILVLYLCSVGSLVGPKRQMKTKQIIKKKKHCSILSLKGPKQQVALPLQKVSP